MAEPTYTLKIDCSALGLDDILIDGSLTGAGWQIWDEWNVPGLVPVTRNAPSDWLHGEPATSFKWADGIFSGEIIWEGDDQGALIAAETHMRAGLGRLSYPVRSTRNGYPQRWVARPGTLMPSPLRYEDLRDNQHPYSLTIPVHPISTPGGA